MFLLCKRLFTKLFWLIPLKNNKIFFSSYEGKQYSCNPKAIYEQLKNEEKSYYYIWEYNSSSVPDELKQNVIIVKHNSLSYFYHLLTAKYIITNSGISAAISLRKEQVCVNTWHGGGAYKKVGAVVDEKVNGTVCKELAIIAKQTSYFLSSSQEFTKVMEKSTFIPRNKFLNIGMPRNDIFFAPSKMENLRKKVRDYCNLSDEKKVVLFAPTYRGKSGNMHYSTLIPDIDNLTRALKSKFGGEWVVLYRSHYYKTTVENNPSIIDVSEYQDMQELLCLADVLITDYSSCIWDYSLIFRPCFLFVPDLEEYENERGGFYTQISTWPGIVCKNDEELAKKIFYYDRVEYIQKVKIHHSSLVSYDKGTATEHLLRALSL